MVQSITVVQKSTLLNLLTQYVRKDELVAGNLTERVDTFTPTNGQTSFNLTSTPTQPHLSKVFLNGVKASYGTEYMINSSVLNWLAAVALNSSDTLEIFYYS